MADRKGRPAEPCVFFVYDHNMLKKEEDDLKDAILYFYPEDVGADDQCALCGQVMGMSEFLGATLSKAPPHMYSFEQVKLALKRVGSYSLVLQGQSSIADTLLRSQLDRLYSTFVTFCGSLDSLRLRYKDSHASFVQELGSVWRSLLVGGTAGGTAASHNTLLHTLAAVPYVDLPKSGGQLFQQGAHLLQTCQKRPYVLAGAILYKNCVLCSQLSPDLTQQLTCLQNQMPHISRTTEFDLPVGCKIITLFLTDKQLQEISSLDQQAKRHCKTADFRARRDSGEAGFSEAAAGRRRNTLNRRATCPDIGSLQSAAKSVSEGAAGRLLRQDERACGEGVMGVEQMSWRRPPRHTLALSQVPILECCHGESPDLPHTAPTQHTYTQLRPQPTQPGEDSETDEGPKETQSHIPAETPTHSQQTQNENKADTATSEMSGEAGTFVQRQEEVLDPSISDLEDHSENEEHLGDTHNELNDHQSYNDLPSQGQFQDSASKVNDDNEIVSEASIDEAVVRCKLLESAESPVTVSEAAQHSVVSHVADVHVGAGAGQQHLAAQAQPPSQCGGHTHADEHCSKQLHDPVSEEGKNSKAIVTCKESQGNEPDCSASGRVDHLEKAEVNCDVKSLERSESPTKHLSCSEYCEHCKCEPSGTLRGIHLTLAMENDTSLISTTMQGPAVLDAPFTGIVDQTTEESADDAAEESEIEPENPCISCLELLSTTDNEDVGKSNTRCSQCLAKLSKHSNISNCEIIDFGKKSENNKHQFSASDCDSKFQERENSRELLEKGISSSFSSDVSTDSTISRYWTHEMDGLNDVTLYVQCHSDISLLLVMENPDKYQENLFHALWKGSLSQLADLDYYIKESCDMEDYGDEGLPGYTYTRLDTLTGRLSGGGCAGREESGGPQPHMMTTLHAEFTQHHCLSDIHLRSQLSYCYGQHSGVEEVYFQPDTHMKLGSGLPLPRDPAFALENTVRSRLTRDRKIALI